MLNLDPKDGVTGLYERPTPRRVAETVKEKEYPQWVKHGKAQDAAELHKWLTKKGIDITTFWECARAGDIALECSKLVFIYNTGRKERGDWNSSRGNRWIAGGAEGALWRIQDVRNFDNRTIIMCEGESDAMRVLTEIRGRDAGVGVVAIPSASWVPDEAMANLIGRNRNVVFFFDNDEAGAKAVYKMQTIFAAVHGCNYYVARVWDGYKDICDEPQEMLRYELDKILTLS